MKISKFFIVGASNTLLTYLFYIVLVKLGVNYKIALFFDYVLGILFGYYLNRYWTFYSHQHRRSFTKYITLYVGIFLFNSLLLILSVDFFLLDPILAQFIIIGAISLVGFVVQDKWVFGSKANL
jgi:putative flippase GtrA